MMRIGLPNGIATSEQVELIADIAAKHGRDLVDITVRQAIQLALADHRSAPRHHSSASMLPGFRPRALAAMWSATLPAARWPALPLMK